MSQPGHDVGNRTELGGQSHSPYLHVTRSAAFQAGPKEVSRMLCQGQDPGTKYIPSNGFPELATTLTAPPLALVCAFYLVLCPDMATMEETEAWQAPRLPEGSLLPLPSQHILMTSLPTLHSVLRLYCRLTHPLYFSAQVFSCWVIHV